MTDRLRCEVIGCARTAAAGKHRLGASIVCGRCWRTTSAKTRRLYREARRRCRAGGDPLSIDRYGRLWNRLFWRVVEEANAAAVGLR